MVRLHLTLESAEREIEKSGNTRKAKVFVYNYLNKINDMDQHILPNN